MGGAGVYTINDISEIQGYSLCDTQEQAGTKCPTSGVLQVGEASRYLLAGVSVLALEAAHCLSTHGARWRQAPLRMSMGGLH